MLLSDLTFALSLLLPVSAALRSSGNGHLAEPEMSKRVAIIGAGAGGSSAAYHLSKYAQEKGISTTIDVFETSSRAGGRTTTVNAWSDPNSPVELGGSIFVEVNHILVNAMKEFNLSTKDHGINTSEVDGLPDLGVWNGEQFVIVTTDSSWWDKAKLLWRYGTAPIKTNSLMKSTVGKFLKMYESPVFPWKSITEAVEEVGLLDTTGVTGEQFLKANGVSDLFAKEIIQASTRVNYASNLPLIHGLETMVCMATDGAMAIQGGNWRIFAHMLNSSSTISPHFNTTVAKLEKQDDGAYWLTTSAGDGSLFDTVILAAPHQFAHLDIDPVPKRIPDNIPYVKLQVTLFATPHRLSPRAFNMEEDKQVPQYVLTTLKPDEDYGNEPNVGTPGFFSISVVSSGVNPHSTSPRPEHIYKIFSPDRINATFLSHILGQPVTEQEAEIGSPNGAVSWIHHKTWYSYPREYPRVTFEEIKLGERLYYTSGIESFISTMETSALSGKNVAKLVVDDWSEVAETGELKMQSGDGNWEYKPLEGSPELKAKL